MTCERPSDETTRIDRSADSFYLVGTVLCLVLILVAIVSSSDGGLSATRRPLDPTVPRARGRTFGPSFTRPKVAPISREEALSRSLSLDEARFYRRLAGQEVQCELCPTLCRLRDGERGQCRVRVNYGGTLYTLVYGRLVAEHIDPIEKKPLDHFLPGTSVYSLATAGCNLSCLFCQNWQISQAFPEEAPFVARSPEEVVRLAIEAHCPSIAYTYTEPSVFYEYMLDCSRLAKQKGLSNVWVTCGYLNERPLRELAPYLDAANVDLKGFDERFYSKWCGAQLAPVLRTIEILKEEKVHIEITNLLVPGGNDDPDTIRKLCQWVVKNVGPQVPVHFSRYHPSYKMERPGPTPLATLRLARRIAAEEGLKYVYVGNIEEPEAMHTLCARCGETLIERRMFYVLANVVRSGTCPRCGARIPGVWNGGHGRPLIKIPVQEPLPPAAAVAR